MRISCRFFSFNNNSLVDDLGIAKQSRESRARSNSIGSVNSVPVAASTQHTEISFSQEDIDKLKKMKAQCHRHIGSLFYTTGRYKEAEDHLRKYIYLIEKQQSLNENTPSVNEALNKDKSAAYSLLASIYDRLPNCQNEAIMADKKALECMTPTILSQFNSK